MPQGFFARGAKPVPKTNTLVPACGACGLHKTCRSPRMPVTGLGELGVLIVAEAPGETEDEEGVQLVGKAGKLLRKVMKKLGVDLDRDCWKTNALICRPTTESGHNRKPTKAEIGYCRPNLIQTLKNLRPRVIVPLGGPAVESVVGHLWREDVGEIGRWVGWQIPCQHPNAWICPTYHPSYVLREEDQVLDIWFERHLEAALDVVGRPWAEPQRWEDDVQIVMDDDEAAWMVRDIAARQMGAVAFDYETTVLKPETPLSQVVSCAVAWGRSEPEIVLAFPWVGEARRAVGELLRGPLPKIASNMKFEDRYTLTEFGHRVRGWCHDTMLFAHVMDNRREICSLKFQAFVHLGMASYDDHVHPYLTSGGARSPNRVRELNARELLKYNGLDALLEFRLAVRQRQLMGFDVPWIT